MLFCLSSLSFVYRTVCRLLLSACRSLILQSDFVLSPSIPIVWCHREATKTSFQTNFKLLHGHVGKQLGPIRCAATELVGVFTKPTFFKSMISYESESPKNRFGHFHMTPMSTPQRSETLFLYYAFGAHYAKIVPPKISLCNVHKIFV